MHYPKLSVIIPNYNHGHYLTNCLTSVFTQDHLPSEVIVIDDASTDNSLDILKIAQQRYKNLRVLKNAQNQGVISVINRGLREAQEEYVLILAADDWVLPGLFARSLNLLSQHPNAAFCSSFSLQLVEDNRNLNYFYTPIPRFTAGYIPSEEVQKLLCWDDSWFMGNTVILHRESALHCRGFRAELGSFCDNFLYRQLALKQGCCFLPEPLAVWRRPKGGYARTTLNDIALLDKIGHQALALMKKQYADLFLNAVVARWQRRWQYLMINALFDLNEKRKIDEFQLAWDIRFLYQNFFNKKNMMAGRLHLLMKVYFFFRFRFFDIIPVALRRMTWFFWCLKHRKSLLVATQSQ